jgi:hypothetical protein
MADTRDQDEEDTEAVMTYAEGIDEDGGHGGHREREDNGTHN